MCQEQIWSMSPPPYRVATHVMWDAKRAGQTSLSEILRAVCVLQERTRHHWDLANAPHVHQELSRWVALPIALPAAPPVPAALSPPMQRQHVVWAPRKIFSALSVL